MSFSFCGIVSLLVMLNTCSSFGQMGKERVEVYALDDTMDEKWTIYFYDDEKFVEQTKDEVYQGDYFVWEYNGESYLPTARLARPGRCISGLRRIPTIPSTMTTLIATRVAAVELPVATPTLIPATVVAVATSRANHANKKSVETFVFRRSLFLFTIWQLLKIPRSRNLERFFFKLLRALCFWLKSF